MKLIGRDKLLSREIYPRLKHSTPFLLTGQRGIGKSSILKWACEHLDGNDKLYLSCRETYGHMLRRIAAAQGLKTDKMKLAEIEREIIMGKKITLFIDDIERMTPKQAGFFTLLNESWNIFLSGIEPYREELKRLTWGKQKIEVMPLEKKERLRLADECILKTGSLVNRSTIVSESRGVPGRALAIAKGEPIRDDAERVKGEEINIAPVLLLFIVGVIAVRYVGAGIGERDLYILGGIGIGLAIFFRYFFWEMRK